jgi:hypothetical protein
MTKEEVESAIGALEKWSRTVDNWVLICAAFVALFLAAEVVFSVLHWRNEKRLRPLRVEQAQMHAKELAGLGNIAAAANARAAEAELKLAELRKPRHKALEGNEASIAAVLALFPHTAFDIGMGPNDGEVEDFIWRLEPILWAAGWKQIDWTYPGGFPGEVFRNAGPAGSPHRFRMGSAARSNVVVELLGDDASPLSKPAQALVKALNEIGIEAELRGFNIHNANTNAVHILIGPKR